MILENQVVQKLKLEKNVFTKNGLLNWYFSMKKKWKDSDNFWHRKLTLKVRNQDFSIATCQTYVDLPKKFLPFDAEVAEKNLEWYAMYVCSV